MKKNWRNKAFRFTIAALLVLTNCNKGHEPSAQGVDLYTCSMHPQVVQDKAGTCPICGMDLVLKTRPGEGVQIARGLGYLLKPTNSVVNTSIRSVLPVRKSMEIRIE